ncbi:MAG: glycosyltransferase family 2 protein [Blastocatellia bacterium]
MPTITAVLGFDDSAPAMIESFAAQSAVSEIILLARESHSPRDAQMHAKARVIIGDVISGRGINALLAAATGDYLLVVLPGEQVEFGQRAIERYAQAATDTGAAFIYSDFRDDTGNGLSDHPLIDYQPGSIRDSFDFGSVIFVTTGAAREAINRHGAIDERLQWGALYDLRLKMSVAAKPLRIPEPLYTRVPRDLRKTGDKQFDYVDPRRRDVQVEMEAIATAHLQRIKAYLAPQFAPRPAHATNFPVRASVVIPVRNRERTIAEAVRSALAQQADFAFNIIVVDNHSTDQTTAILAELASRDERLIHLIPARKDLGIGGCWNEAVYSAHCGEYAVQLDSDDLYASEETLAKIVAVFDEGRYAMVIGSYTIVDFDLREVPPGLIDHREWTRDNGRNNALRINGLGAPRGFYVPLLREIGLPNVSYGEDYAAALRISRDYEIGRIYESVYYARRWEGNSDAALPLQTANRYDYYKDYLRTVEIEARRRMNQS